MEIEVIVRLAGGDPANIEACARQIMLLIAAKLIEASVNPHNGSERKQTSG